MKTVPTDLKSRALALGFDAAAIARLPGEWAASDRLESFLTQNHHGTMEWMATEFARRQHPQALWPQARSALIVAMSYAPGHDPMETLLQKSTGNISVYARGRDYHDVLKGKLKELAGAFASAAGAQVKVFVDTAPLMEKPLAELAGLGWQGKHTNLVSRSLGSWFFLGVMLTDAELEPDAPESDHCGSCRACLDVCPTNAFPAPYRLDARRCISYLTIEHKGPIPRELREGMGNRIYGCDDCLAVCPWNKFAGAAREAKLRAREELLSPSLESLSRLSDPDFRQLFAASPVKRTGRGRFVRNVCIAIGNSGDARLVPALIERLEDSAAIVRGAAIWALAKLDPAAFQREKRIREPAETEPEVLTEWGLP